MALNNDFCISEDGMMFESNKSVLFFPDDALSRC